MRFRGRLILLIVASLASPALAQDDRKPDQLRKMYDDALAQLKSVQDRRNELSQENEKLTAKLKELEAKVAAAEGELASLKKEAAGAAEQTYFLRAHHAAWQSFMARYPDLVSKWRLYLGNPLLLPQSTDADEAWPFDMAG